MSPAEIFARKLWLAEARYHFNNGQVAELHGDYVNAPIIGWMRCHRQGRTWPAPVCDFYTWLTPVSLTRRTVSDRLAGIEPISQWRAA